MANYRQRIDIIADILEVVSFDAKKTQIMFKANLSYKALTKYLSEVIRASLITYEQERQCYKLTDKGHNYLNVYKAYSETNKHVEQRLNYLFELCPNEKINLRHYPQLTASNTKA